MDYSLDEIIKGIPLYQQLYGDEIADFSLQKSFDFPVLTKPTLAQSYPHGWQTEKLQKAMSNDEILSGSTSGSSGSKIFVFGSKEHYLNEFKRVASVLPGIGSTDNYRRGLFTTPHCSSTACFKDFGPLKSRIRKPNTLLLNNCANPICLTRDDITRICDEINIYQVNYLDVDPIYFCLFLKLKENYGITTTFKHLKLISYSYEFAPKACLNYIKQQLNVPLHSAYGATEVGYLYMQNIQGYYELIPGDIDVFFKPFNPQKNIYELYVTAANNQFMPLINYAIGDLVMIKPDSLPLVQTNPKKVILSAIVGRAKQVLFSDENKPLTLYEIDEFLFDCSPEILLYDLKQTPTILGKSKPPTSPNTIQLSTSPTKFPTSPDSIQLPTSPDLFGGSPSQAPAVLKNDQHSIAFNYFTGDNTKISSEQESQIVDYFKSKLNANTQFSLIRSIAPSPSGKYQLIS